MTRGRLFAGAVAATLAMGVAPAFAQRTNSSGESTGTAVGRSSGGDGGGGGAVSQPSGGSTSSSSGSSSGSSISSPAPSTTTSVSAPTRPAERRQRANPRGEGARQPSEGSRAVPRGSSEGTAGTGTSGRTTAAEGSSPSDRAVPTYSRPRGGRPQAGTAVERRFARPGDSQFATFYSAYPYRPRFWPGFGFGLTYFDPLWYDPFFYGYSGYGTGYYGGAYGGGYGGYGGGYGGPYGGYQGTYGPGAYGQSPTGSLRLKIKPKDAQVYVDGYFAGIVDDFDGLFQKLTIEAGGRRIEVRAEGYEPAQFDVLITPGETVTYQGELQPIHPIQ